MLKVRKLASMDAAKDDPDNQPWRKYNSNSKVKAVVDFLLPY